MAWSTIWMLSSIRGQAAASQMPFHGVQIDADRAQDLADFIVQLAGEVPTLLLLDLDHAAGEDLQSFGRVAQGLFGPLAFA